MRYVDLFVGYNEEEDCRILICAFDMEEAWELANEYRFERGFSGPFKISEFKGKFDGVPFGFDNVIA